MTKRLLSGPAKLISPGFLLPRRASQIIVPIFFLALAVLFIPGCKDKGVPPDESIIGDGAEEIHVEPFGFEGKFPLSMNVVEPYLYVCAGSDGVWRRDVRALTEWEYLGLKDTSLGEYSNVGATNVDVSGEDVLIAYNAAQPHVEPEDQVAVWRSNDAGRNWTRSDAGIRETVDFSVEGNAIADVKRSPQRSETVVAVEQNVLYKSSDGGISWVLTQGERGMILNWGEVAWNPNREGEVWNFGETAIFSPFLIRLSDFGSSADFSVDFTALGFPSDGNVSSVAFGHSDPDVVYAAVLYIPSPGEVPGKIIKTLDGGQSWITDGIRLPDSGFASKIISHPSLDILYMAGGKRVYAAYDGGGTVELLKEFDQSGIQSLALDIQGNQLFVGIARDGIYKIELTAGE